MALSRFGRAAVTLARMAARTDINSGSKAKRVEIVVIGALAEIAIEHDIGERRQPARDHVHQQKRQIVKQIDGRKLRIEFEGVEQHRRIVDQNDIAEMQIAVAVAHISVVLAL